MTTLEQTIAVIALARVRDEGGHIELADDCVRMAKAFEEYYSGLAKEFDLEYPRDLFTLFDEHGEGGYYERIDHVIDHNGTVPDDTRKADRELLSGLASVSG